jgi:hypothetical protein
LKKIKRVHDLQSNCPFPFFFSLADEAPPTAESKPGKKSKVVEAAPAKSNKRNQVNKQQQRASEANFTHPWLYTTLKGHTGKVLDMDFSSNGKYLATCSEGNLACFNFYFYSLATNTLTSISFQRIFWYVISRSSSAIISRARSPSLFIQPASTHTCLLLYHPVKVRHIFSFYRSPLPHMLKSVDSYPAKLTQLSSLLFLLSFCYGKEGIAALCNALITNCTRV